MRHIGQYETSTPVIQDFPPPIEDTPQFVNPPENGYLPPVLYPPLDNPPLQDELPPSPPSLYQAPPPVMKILNMSCILDTSFKTLVKIDSKTGVQPVMEGKEGCIIRTSAPAVYAIEIEDVRRMSECGVRRCAPGVATKANMCATLRIPTIKGLRLPEDVTMTLQCTPRDSVVSHTKHIRLGPTSTKNTIVASGGGNYNFDSHIFLMRKSPGSNNFDQLLQTGSVVQLGEEMLLRTKIQEGDGWKYSRMGPVIIRNEKSKKHVTLVEENGCRSPGIRSVCPFHPKQLNPLDNILYFRAFLFDDSAKGDDMILSVRMTGCLHAQDCFRNNICEDSTFGSPHRLKRDINEKFNETTKWESVLQFKVVMSPQTETKPPVESYTTKDNQYSLPSVFVIVLLIVLLLLVFFLTLILSFRLYFTHLGS
nr:unnamed protein product [Callosobruchus analis]